MNSNRISLNQLKLEKHIFYGEEDSVRSYVNFVLLETFFVRLNLMLRQIFSLLSRQYTPSAYTATCVQN
jgi:hypothetical protein